jgi:hypothetical protein
LTGKVSDYLIIGKVGTVLPEIVAELGKLERDNDKKHL